MRAAICATLLVLVGIIILPYLLSHFPFSAIGGLVDDSKKTFNDVLNLLRPPSQLEVPDQVRPTPQPSPHPKDENSTLPHIPNTSAIVVSYIVPPPPAPPQLTPSQAKTPEEVAEQTKVTFMNELAIKEDTIHQRERQLQESINTLKEKIETELSKKTSRIS